jgi:hypothetical protein
VIDLALPSQNAHHNFSGKSAIALTQRRDFPTLKQVGSKCMSGINPKEDFKSDFPGRRDVRQGC